MGNIKGVGRIYQQTIIDAYNQVAFANLYTSKHAITSADLLNDKVLPIFEEYEIPLLRILTDRGTEFEGKTEHREYEFYLNLEGIDHSKTQVRTLKEMGSVNVCMAKCRISFMPSPSIRNCTITWKFCSNTWMIGFGIITNSDATAEDIVTEKRLWRLSRNH